LKQYRAEGHVVIAAGTGAQLLEQALVREHIDRDVVLELPGFLGLGAIIKSTDLIATLPRHIGETLAKVNDLAVHPCPVPVDGFASAALARQVSPRSGKSLAARSGGSVIQQFALTVARVFHNANSPCASSCLRKSTQTRTFLATGGGTIIRQTELSFTLLNDRARSWRTLRLNIFERLYRWGTRPHAYRWRPTVRTQSLGKRFTQHIDYADGETLR
jgi:hypothetical protein